MEKSPSIPVRVRTVLHNSKFGSKKLFGRKKRERKKKNAYSLAFQVQTASGDTSPPSFNLIVIEMLHVLSLNLARPVVRSAPKKAFAVNKKQNKQSLQSCNINLPGEDDKVHVRTTVEPVLGIFTSKAPNCPGR